MHTPYSLLIIDMQEDFYVTSDLEVTKNVQREVREAVAANADIIYVEYDCCGPTLPVITAMSDGYDKNFYVTKFDDDGSKQIYGRIKEYKLHADHFKVTGVNTDCCVRSTVLGLCSRFPQAKIEVINDACASLWRNKKGDQFTHNRALTLMKNRTNVSIKEGTLTSIGRAIKSLFI